MLLVPVSRTSSDLSRSLDRLFDDSFLDRAFGAAPQGEATGLRGPALDVTESERAHTVHVDLPSMAKGDVKIAIVGRRVNGQAAGQMREEQKDGGRVLYRESSVSNYFRSVASPEVA